MKPVFLVYKDGRAYRTTDYWFDSDQLVYLAAVGTRLKLPIQALGLDTTAKLNREHGLDSRFLQRRTSVQKELFKSKSWRSATGYWSIRPGVGAMAA
jgi:hypothetical protein